MVFRPDKSNVAKRFQRSVATYDEHAIIQKVMSGRLVDLLAARCTAGFSRVLEVGCCTGFLTEYFCRRFLVDTLYLNDIVPEFCSEARDRVVGLAPLAQLQALPGDIEKIHLPEGLGLVLSSSTLQWLHDFPRLFDRFADSLEVGGYLAFSLFGKGTMEEIRTLTGHGLHYPDLAWLCDILNDRFTRIAAVTEANTVWFSSPRQVLRHIQATGVSGLGSFRWTPGRLKDFEDQYIRLFGGHEGVRLSYVSHLVLAEKRAGGKP